MNGTLDKYRVVAELGRGGMGTVHLAIARGPARFSKLVVIKHLNSHFAEDPHFTAMLLEEARLAARLQHPKIVQTNEVVGDPAGYFIVMEYIDGVSLLRLLRRLRARTGTPAQYVQSLYVRAIVDVLIALDYAHGLKDFDGTPLNIIHRDVNPANVVVGYDGQVKLIDFGIAKAADTSEQTRAGMVKGKIHYISPEAAVGDPIDRRTDVFSVGAMLWDALAGQRLWHAMPTTEIEHALFRGAIPSPRSVNPGISKELEAICMKALAATPADRYPDATSFRTDLERAWGAEPMSIEALSAAMSMEFFEEREQVRARLVEQLQRVDQGATGLRAGYAGGGVQRRTGSSDPSSTAYPTPDRAAVEIAEARLAPRKVLPGRGLRLASAVAAAGVATVVLLAAAASLAMHSQQGKSARSQAGRNQDGTSPAPPGRGRDLDGVPLAAVPSPRAEVIGPTPLAGSIPPPHPEPLESAVAAPAPTRRRVASMAHMASRNSTSVNTETARDPPRPRAGADVPPPVDDHAGSAAPPPPASQAAPLAQKAVIESHRPEIESCWYRARMEQPFLDVRVTVAATVASDGHVSDVASSASEVGTTRLQACIVNAVRGWRFPAPTGGVPSRVSFTFE